ncbi:MAG: nucleoside-diphosphate kinase [Legionellales bacterium]|jgi:nucleoside-diphosphate kinase|nr:nucleoside-diphosphate kinase [Legionellales bacterium]
MSTERTLSIIKPDGVTRSLIGTVIERFESKGLKVVAAKLQQLTTNQAQEFYGVHKERPFYNDLVKYMTSGPVLTMVLEGENAVLQNRTIMGATNPAEAAEGTIRRDFAESIEANVVHGSDSAENAAIEIDFFFSKEEVVSY